MKPLLFRNPDYRCNRWLGLLTIAMALTFSTPGLSQATVDRPPVFDATHLSEPADLSSIWLIHAGDDPQYALPNYNDSNWIPFDPHGSITNALGGAQPEVIWYRLHIRVDPSQDRPSQDNPSQPGPSHSGLALREQSISRAFEVYTNGVRLIASGQVKPFVPYTVGARRLAPIPAELLASGNLVVAIRVHISKAEWNGQNAGYFATNLTIGQESTLYQQDWLAVLSEKLVSWLGVLILIAVGVVGLVLYFAQRRQREYLWIFALALIQIAEFPFDTMSLFKDLPIGWEILSHSFRAASPIVWISLYFGFVQREIGWRLRIFLIFAGIMNAVGSLDDLLPSLPGAWAILENLPFVIMLSVVTPIVLIVHLRRGNREAGILLIPVTLFSGYIYLRVVFAILFQIPSSRTLALEGMRMIDSYQAGPFVLGLDPISGILSSVSLAIIMLLRSSTTSRRQALIEGELAAAQEVQQVILPEQTEPIPGFTIESLYEPAQQVGGDFFQVIPTHDGGMLLVLGDVAGKGLPAAMLVSVMVGAIRATAEYTHAPEKILASLNERLIGRSRGGFSTALAAHISASGTVTISNAGHLSPYMDGQELTIPGALPLGILSGTHYETTTIQLPSGSRLTFYSDGVIEAQNQAGELFGFERGQQLSTHPAVAIADAAKQFGQSDDITVVAITRDAVVAAAA